MKKIYLFLCFALLACDKAPSVKYPSLLEVGLPINPHWLSRELDFENFIKDLDERRRLAEKSLAKQEITDEDMRWIIDSQDEQRKGLNLRVPGDVLWKYDNREWASFNGQSGVVLLREGIVVWYEPTKFQ